MVTDKLKKIKEEIDKSVDYYKEGYQFIKSLVQRVEQLKELVRKFKSKCLSFSTYLTLLDFTKWVSKFVYKSRSKWKSKNVG